MLYLIVTVNEGIHCVLPEQIVTIAEDKQFSELYEAFTSGQFNNQGVKVYVRQNKVDKWVEVNDGLSGNLEIMKVLGYNHVKFTLLVEPVAADIEPPSFPDAFDIMMRSARQPKLPQIRTEHTRCDLLYNEIIDLLCWLKGRYSSNIRKRIYRTYYKCSLVC